MVRRILLSHCFFFFSSLFSPLYPSFYRDHADTRRRKEIETCPKYKAGELDIDSLCSELAAKACCTETGMAVPKENFEAALWRLVGDDAKAKSMEKPPHML